jgi:hypothetical protein
MAEIRPPVPLALADRPTAGGLVIPWVNVRLADGGADFRQQHRSRAERCWHGRLCQLCGKRIAPGSVLVLIGGPTELADRTFHEPPMHPACAGYVTRACPVVAGRRATFASGPSPAETARGGRCPEPGCDCGGWLPSEPRGDRAPRPNHPWWAVWARDYVIAVRPDGALYGGHLSTEPVRVRHISDPPGGTAWPS